MFLTVSGNGDYLEGSGSLLRIRLYVNNVLKGTKYISPTFARGSLSASVREGDIVKGIFDNVWGQTRNITLSIR